MTVTEQPRLHQDWINPHAYGIVKALQKHGHTTYLVGGCVRDLMLGIHPKDFDIATTARPEEVQKIIYRAYMIGKRFRLVLVRRDDVQFEVATFRRMMTNEEISSEETEGDNVFGTPEEDAKRRDFTINGLFYDPVADKVIDYGHGKEDLEQRWVRMIGEPNERLKEDPIRILRAIRLKHMIHFSMEEKLREAIQNQAETLLTSVLPRRREEILKFLRLPDPSQPFIESYDMGVLKFLSPTLVQKMEEEPQKAENFLDLLSQAPPANSEPAFLFGLLVHAFVRAFFQENPDHIRSKDILENETLSLWMREELGMFKAEMAMAAKALHFEGIMDRIEDFDRKGERRQLAMVGHEAFPLAVELAERDIRLDSGGLAYWKAKAQWAFERRKNDVTLQRPKRKRRPRRKPENPSKQEQT